ncbi:MAG TPA: hypothetical protein VFR79_08865 [Nitrospira sp.]|nr:hypothetical protein [Nitrospira sp.]
MFQTLTGSLIILLAILGIIFILALFMTALLRWIFGTADDAVAWSAMATPAQISSLRRAA